MRDKVKIINGKRVVIVHGVCECGAGYQQDFYAMENFIRRVK
jgi:hypothetical protein